MKINLVSLLFFCCSVSFAQELKELRHWTTSQHSADFYISLDDKKVKFADTLDYYWFKSQAIHVTQGYASGNLLNGPFTKFYVSGQLAESGQFELGLRVGEWKTWFDTGQLESIYNYDEGVLDGNYFIYDASGKIIESGNYRDGKYHGEKIENGEVTKYRNGKAKKKKEPKVDDDEQGKEEKRWKLLSGRDHEEDGEESGQPQPEKKDREKGRRNKEKSEKSTEREENKKEERKKKKE